MSERCDARSVVVAVPENSHASQNTIGSPDRTSEDGSYGSFLCNMRLVETDHDDEDDEHCDVRHVEYFVADSSNQESECHQNEHCDAGRDAECLFVFLEHGDHFDLDEAD